VTSAQLEAARTVRENLLRINENIASASLRSGRRPEDVTVLAASKTISPDVVGFAIDAGLRVFGENRVQEAQEKIPVVSAGHRPITWHFIGHLQTNKVRPALQLFEMIQSVDSIHLATALDGEASRLARKIPILIEVNTSGEPSKHGFAVTEVGQDVATLSDLVHLDITGLMTIGPLTEDLAAVRAAFRSLRALRDQLSREYPAHTWNTLSMGMSEDYEIAIEEGATIVRLGRVLFGPRS